MPIQINGTSGISGVDGSAGTPALQGTDTNTGIAFGSDVIIGSTGGVERWRTTPSGQWLVGTSTASSNGSLLVLMPDNTNQTGIVVRARNTGGTASQSALVFEKPDTTVNSAIVSDIGTSYLGFVHNGAERMRITSQGSVNISSVTDNAVNALYITHGGSGGPGIVFAWGTNATYAGGVLEASISRAATSAAALFKGYSSGTGDTEFNLRGDGNGYCDGSWVGGGADYAEYFEWSDANINAEDRRGISVVLDGSKIREAVAGEDPIGVISGNPSVVGDAAWNKWSGKYLRDEFGSYIQEDYEVVNDEGETVIQQRRKLNPAYEPDQEYVSREQRPEWDCVGLMGKLRIRKGQVTGSRWIKMRDINDSVEEWLVR